MAVWGAVKLFGERLGDFDLSSSRWRRLPAVVDALGAPSRNSRSPGMRIMGLRMIDARTGGPVTVRTVIVRDAVRGVEKAAIGEVYRPIRARAQARREAMKPRMQEIQRQYAADPEGRTRAIKELYETNPVNQLGCLGPFLVPLAADYLAMFVTPRHQTLHEMLAGTVVVIDDL